MYGGAWRKGYKNKGENIYIERTRDWLFKFGVIQLESQFFHYVLQK